MSKQVTGYSRTQITLHWVIFALVALQFIGHNAIVEVSEALAKGLETDMPLQARAHVFLGGLTLILALWRIYLRLSRGVPPAPEGGSAIQNMIAKLTHLVLNATLIIMPISGAGSWFGNDEYTTAIHATFKIVLIATIALHILGALVQQYIKKTNVINRMMKSG